MTLPGVAIFNYHGLADSLPADMPQPAQRFWLSSHQFQSHLECIRDERFHVALLAELTNEPNGATRKSPAVVLTFDDGLVSDYEIAFPLLSGFGMRAVFFVNGSTAGQSGYLSWRQIAEMHQAGMSIGSHSHRHVDLTVLPTADLDAELTASKNCLEDRLGARVEFLAAPHGLLDRRVVRRALLAGYRAVCSTRCLPALPGSKVLTRITLHRDIPVDEFRRFLKRELPPYMRRLSRGLLHRPRAIAGHLNGVLRYRLLKQPAVVSK